MIATFIPDAHVETVTTDGVVVNYSSTGTTFSSLRSSLTAEAFGEAYASNMQIFYDTYAATNSWRAIGRGIMLFDTSSLGAGARINKATLRVYVNQVSDSFNRLPSTTGAICVVSSNPSSNTNVVGADFTSLGSTRFSTDKTFSEVYEVMNDTLPYIYFDLNASGIGAINLTGITKLGLRNPQDIDGTPPAWEAEKSCVVDISTADAGVDQVPTLTVEYNLPTITGCSSIFGLTSITF